MWMYGQENKSDPYLYTLMYRDCPYDYPKWGSILASPISRICPHELVHGGAYSHSLSSGIFMSMSDSLALL